jgi:hypothetical protein
VNNKIDFATIFALPRRDRIPTGGGWLRDLAPALAIVVASSLLGMIGDAHPQQRPIQQSADTGSPAPIGPAVTKSTAK